MTTDMRILGDSLRKLENANNTNLEHYSTIWNIINLLGAHELIGHGVMDFFNDSYGTHYLTYGYQMKNESWKNTTKKFKEEMINGFHSHYNKSRSDLNVNKRGIHSWLEKHELFEPFYYERRRDSIFYENRISPLLKDTSIMKDWREDFMRFPKSPPEEW